MSLLLVTFAIEYSGGRLDQLRIDPIRRDCCFYAAGDYLLDDLKALRIPLPNFVHVSRDCSRVKYTWSASTDPRRPIVRQFSIYTVKILTRRVGPDQGDRCCRRPGVARAPVIG